MDKTTTIQDVTYSNGHHKDDHTFSVDELLPEWDDLPVIDPISGEAATLEDAPKKRKKRQRLKSDALIEALEALNLSLRLNLLEDNVEIDGRRLDDITLSDVNLKLVDLGFSRADIGDAVNVLAGRNAYHPVRDYLLGLKWDGTNHLTTLLSHFIGDGVIVRYKNQERPLYQALIGRWLLACVARALDGHQENAFKHQTPVLTIIGKQGIGKSSWVRWLVSGVGYQFHRESMINPHSTEDQRSMVTKWIWEVSELSSSLRRADRDSLKSFITTEWFTYRKPYGKHPVTKPALCNLVGTLNPETGFLDDPTGHRRFLPVVLNGIDHSYKDKIDVNQLWAQLVHLYRQGQSPALLPEELAALNATFEEHEVENPLSTYIQMYFDVEPGNQDFKCHTATIMSRLRNFEVNLPNEAKWAGRALNDVLAPMGLERKKVRLDGVVGYGWIGIHPNNKKPSDFMERAEKLHGTAEE